MKHYISSLGTKVNCKVSYFKHAKSSNTMLKNLLLSDYSIWNQLVNWSSEIGCLPYVLETKIIRNFILICFLRKSGWPSGLRRQTQEIYSSLQKSEHSGPRMRAWVRIPLLTKPFYTFSLQSKSKIIGRKNIFIIKVS